MGNSTAKEELLKIKILTGETQTQQLFDFHSIQKQQSISDLVFPSIIGYKDDNISDAIQPLYRIECNNYRNIVIRELFERSRQFDDSYIWKVLGQGEEMEIQEGDSIKIGKTKITFKELVKGNDSVSKNGMQTLSDKEQTQRMDLSNTREIIVKSSQDICRICFESTSTPENPLVSLCKCTGSVKFIHYQCLKDWTSNNVKKDKSSNGLFYSYTEPNCCDLCKQPLENQFKHEGQRYKLYQFEKVQPPYAVFENRYIEEETGRTRVSIYTISIPEHNEIIIGRNHTSQVILRDISVSRSHCFLVYKHGRLFIQDKKSKFGTLVRPKRGIQFDSHHGLQLQFQSKVINISRVEAFNNCCCAQNNSYFVQINKGFHDQTLQG